VTILAKKKKNILSQELLEVRNQRKKNYPKGALDSAQLHCMRGRHYLAIKMQQKNLAQGTEISNKLSIIYKHIQSMHKELRYQTKIHEIAKRLVKSNLHLFPFS